MYYSNPHFGTSCLQATPEAVGTQGGKLSDGTDLWYLLDFDD